MDDIPKCCLNFCMSVDEKINDLVIELKNQEHPVLKHHVQQKIDLLNEVQQDMKEMPPECDCEEVRSRHPEYFD